MAVIFVFILVGVLCGYVAGYPVTDYALHFPDKGITDYANIWGMRSLTQFTVCFWMKSSGSNTGAPFSYNVPEQDNELLIYIYNNGFYLWIGGKGASRVGVSATDGKWHHICVSWQSSDGAWQLYKDGTLHGYRRGLEIGHTIRAGGSLVLAQEQDSILRFDSTQSFQGSLTDVNVWSSVLSASTIKRLSKSCLSGVGDVYKWSDFIYGVKGKTAVVIPSPCKPLSSQG